MNVISARRAEPLLEIRNLTIRYREGERQVTAVRDVSFTLEPGGALAAVLSFLGFGVQPPAADWGLMISNGRAFRRHTRRRRASASIPSVTFRCCAR
jgi:ABC-type dipeptide/oligopeptide/nickel transport system permease subunit